MVYNFVLVGLGGGIGAMLRYGVSLIIRTSIFPLSTLLINIVGSFALGMLMAWSIDEPGSTPAKLFFATGVCGGFTTFSAFAYENFSLLQAGKSEIAFLYILLSVALSVIAAWAGFKIFT